MANAQIDTDAVVTVLNKILKADGPALFVIPIMR